GCGGESSWAQDQAWPFILSKRPMESSLVGSVQIARYRIAMSPPDTGVSAGAVSAAALPVAPISVCAWGPTEMPVRRIRAPMLVLGLRHSDQPVVARCGLVFCSPGSLGEYPNPWLPGALTSTDCSSTGSTLETESMPLGSWKRAAATGSPTNCVTSTGPESTSMMTAGSACACSTVSDWRLASPVGKRSSASTASGAVDLMLRASIAGRIRPSGEALQAVSAWSIGSGDARRGRSGASRPSSTVPALLCSLMLRGG